MVVHVKTPTIKKEEPSVKVEDMTPEQKIEAFEKFMEQKAERREKGKAKSQARTALINKYKTEFNQLLKAAKEEVEVPRPTKKADIEKIIDKFVERQTNSKARQAARKALLEAHEAEFKKAVAAAEPETE